MPARWCPRVRHELDVDLDTSFPAPVRVCMPPLRTLLIDNYDRCGPHAP